MEIIKITKKGLSKNEWRKVLKVFKNSGVVVYPTDTAYALGGIFDNKKVISKVLKIKNRKDKKFTPNKYWPGPLSIVVTKQYAVRVPKNKFTQELARKVNKPLLASSANITGKKPTYTIKEVLKQFENKKCQPDLILDGGKLKKIKPSTVVLFEKNKLKIIRNGSIPTTDLFA